MILIDDDMRASYQRSDFAKLERGKFFDEASMGMVLVPIATESMPSDVYADSVPAKRKSPKLGG